jgi:hypothetical protein
MNDLLNLAQVKTALNMIPGSERWDNYKHPISQSQLDELAMNLCDGLADENLYQDGEATPAEAEERYEEILTAGSKLHSYAKQNNLTPREISED